MTAMIDEIKDHLRRNLVIEARSESIPWADDVTISLRFKDDADPFTEVRIDVPEIP